MTATVLMIAALLGRDPMVVDLVWTAAEVAAHSDPLHSDPLLAIAVCEKESQFYVRAQRRYEDGSSDYGLFQLNSRWHPQFRSQPSANALYGSSYLYSLVRDHGQSDALSYYNSGGVTRRGREYARSVLRILQRLEGAVGCQKQGGMKTISLPWSSMTRKASDSPPYLPVLDSRRSGKIRRHPRGRGSSSMSREVTVFRNIRFRAWIDKEFVAFPLAFMRVVYNKTANFKGVKKMKRGGQSTTIAFFVFHFNIFQTFPKAKWYTPRKEDA